MKPNGHQERADLREEELQAAFEAEKEASEEEFWDNKVKFNTEHMHIGDGYFYTPVFDAVSTACDSGMTPRKSMPSNSSTSLALSISPASARFGE